MQNRLYCLRKEAWSTRVWPQFFFEYLFSQPPSRPCSQCITFIIFQLTYMFHRSHFKRGFKSSLVKNRYSVIEKPGFVDLAEAVPVSLDTPPYADTGIVPPSFERLAPKTKDEIPMMRAPCVSVRYNNKTLQLHNFLIHGNQYCCEIVNNKIL